MAPYPWLTLAWNRLQQWRLQLPHALLLVGAQGLGKLALAEAFALNLLCKQPTPDGQACQQCHSCHLVMSKNHPDLIAIASQKEIIKIEPIRELVDALTQTPQQGGMRIIIINEAHKMNRAAANALLKTLEEPRPQTLLMLLTDQPALLLPTIRSRCQYLKIKADVQVAQQWLVAQGQSAAVELLTLTQNAPLAALDLVAENYLNSSKTLGLDLLKLVQLKACPLQIAAAWHKQELDTTLVWLQWGLFDLMQYKMRWPVKLEDAFIKLAELLNVTQLVQCYDHILKIRGALKAHINLNAQLVLEELFIELVNYAH